MINGILGWLFIVGGTLMIGMVGALAKLDPPGRRDLIPAAGYAVIVLWAGIAMLLD